MDPYIKRDSFPMDDYIPSPAWRHALARRRVSSACHVHQRVRALVQQAGLRKKGMAFPDDTWGWDEYQEAMLKLTDRPNIVFAAWTRAGAAAFGRSYKNAAPC